LNASSASQQLEINSLTFATASYVTSAITASSLVTASVNLNTITFTKGDTTTFAITVDTGSGGGSVPAGTVSSSAQILNYNIFATTSSNNFVGNQSINGDLNITNNRILTTPNAIITGLNVDGGLSFSQVGNPSDTNMSIQSANKTSMYCSVVSVDSGYNSGSSFVLNASTGSNGYGFSGSADFNMTAQWNGKLARMQVNASNGIETQIVGLAESILFARTAGFPNGKSNTFRVDADSIDLNGAVSLSGSLTIEDGTGDLFVYGNKQFNVGAFQSNVSQSGSANVSQSMNFEVTDISEGVSIASNSQITLANSGTYNIQFSAQILADTGADDVYIWLKKNGTNVSASAGHVVLANNEELIASWNYVVSAAASDYFEIVWQNTNGDAILLAENASGNIPSIPSVILTVTQVR
jgi:hypothetical protein